MTAKEYLKQYHDADKRAKRLRAEYEKELLQIDAVKSVSDIDGMPHGNGINKTVEDKAIRLADKALEYKLAELEAIQIRQTVFDIIYDLPSPESDILIERYVELRPWKDVCKEVAYSWPTVRNHHAAALVMVQKKLDTTKDIQHITSEV